MSGETPRGAARVLAEDEGHAAAALALAARARGASPNPRVGALIVAGGVVAGQGFHEYAAKDHAEIVALRQAGDRARGATLHVTLEPCSTHGRTPPCVDAIIAAGIRRVVACMSDPTARHAGAGLSALRRAGVEVAVGILREQAVALNVHWLASQRLGRPHVTLKLGTSIDGRIAAASGDSRWITGPRARERVHQQRRASDAVLIGSGTLAADDPRLTVRLPERGDRPRGDEPRSTGPLRCVLDPGLTCGTSARLLGPLDENEDGGPVILYTRDGLEQDPARLERADRLREAGALIAPMPWQADRLDLGAVLADLRSRGVLGLLVEGGSRAAGAFLASRLVDRLWIHVGPVVLGGDGTVPAFAGFGASTLSEAVRLRHLRCEQVGDDVALEAMVEGGFDADAELALIQSLDERGR